MREATKEEKESVIEYVESISVDTGINFYAIQQGSESMTWVFCKHCNKWFMVLKTCTVQHCKFCGNEV